MMRSTMRKEEKDFLKWQKADLKRFRALPAAERKEEALVSLKRVGIIDKNGKLAKQYRAER